MSCSLMYFTEELESFFSKPLCPEDVQKAKHTYPGRKQHEIGKMQSVTGEPVKSRFKE